MQIVEIFKYFVSCNLVDKCKLSDIYSFDNSRLESPAWRHPEGVRNCRNSRVDHARQTSEDE